MANIAIMLMGHSYENEVVNLRGVHLREGQISEVPWGLYVARDEMLRWKLTDALIG